MLHHFGFWLVKFAHTYDSALYPWQTRPQMTYFDAVQMSQVQLVAALVSHFEKTKHIPLLVL